MPSKRFEKFFRKLIERIEGELKGEIENVIHFQDPTIEFALSVIKTEHPHILEILQKQLAVEAIKRGVSNIKFDQEISGAGKQQLEQKRASVPLRRPQEIVDAVDTFFARTQKRDLQFLIRDHGTTASVGFNFILWAIPYFFVGITDTKESAWLKFKGLTFILGLLTTAVLAIMAGKNWWERRTLSKAAEQAVNNLYQSDYQAPVLQIEDKSSDAAKSDAVESKAVILRF